MDPTTEHFEIKPSSPVAEGDAGRRRYGDAGGSLQESVTGQRQKSKLRLRPLLVNKVLEDRRYLPRLAFFTMRPGTDYHSHLMDARFL